MQKVTEDSAPVAVPAGAANPTPRANPAPRTTSKPFVKDEHNPNKTASGIAADLKGFFDRGQAGQPPRYPSIDKGECRLALLKNDGCTNEDCAYTHAHEKSSKAQRKVYGGICTDFQLWQKSRADKGDKGGKGKGQDKGKGNAWVDKGKGNGWGTWERRDWRGDQQEWHDSRDDRGAADRRGDRDDRRDDRDDRRDDRGGYRDGRRGGNGRS